MRSCREAWLRVALCCKWSGWARDGEPGRAHSFEAPRAGRPSDGALSRGPQTAKTTWAGISEVALDFRREPAGSIGL